MILSYLQNRLLLPTIFSLAHKLIVRGFFEYFHLVCRRFDGTVDPQRKRMQFSLLIALCHRSISSLKPQMGFFMRHARDQPCFYPVFRISL